MSGDKNPASKPTPVQDVQGDGRWMSLHQRFVADSKDKEAEVVFIGDSLVQLMHQCEIWRELFSPLHALNFGIGGDSTQHVLWRLENGELEHIRPKGPLPGALVSELRSVWAATDRSSEDTVKQKLSRAVTAP